VVGHSQGELAAAHVAGILSLPDAARLVALRSRVIAAHLAGRGAMLSVPEPAGAVRARLAAWGDRLSVAAVNGPASTSVAGEPAAIDELFAQLIADGVRVARIASDFASHSAQVDTIREPLLEAAADIRPRPADVLFSSAVTGGIVDHAALDAEYWFQNLRRPVAFDPAVRALLALGLTGFVEPSAHPLLTAPIEEIAGDAGAEVTTVGSLRMGESDARRMLTSVATAYVGGLPVDWRAATGGTPFWRAVGRGDLAGALGVVLPAQSQSQSQSQSQFGGR
jgi:acyl transferase domain-containing protein